MKKVVFLTGTRADYGKTKPIMLLLEESPDFNLSIFVTGMHMHADYGYTYQEIRKDNFSNIYQYINQQYNTPMEIVLSNTIQGFSNYIKETKPDLIIVHGDRLEALAGAIVGAMNNILVAHIEGGEVSGTIDESIRHAITKMSHAHFVANESAKRRISQLGEREDSIYVTGSPDIDIMLHAKLPPLEKAKSRYNISFDEYCIAIFHPVTTSYKEMALYAQCFVSALLMTKENYIVVHPNNDWGRNFIVEEYSRLASNPRFRVFSSIRFEYFLRFLKHCKCIVGNSSTGIREANVYAIPAVDIGDRQQNRYSIQNSGIIHADYDSNDIVDAIEKACLMPRFEVTREFGDGNSAKHILNILQNPNFWNTSVQKLFIDTDW